MTEVSTSAIEQQIAQLQQQLAEQQAALEQQGVAPHEMPGEREMVHQAVGEQIQQQIPAYAPQPLAPKTLPPGDDTPSYLDPEIQPYIQQLVDIVFTKGLDEAIKLLSQSKNNVLVDAFHDAIVDELVAVMTEQGKLPTIPT